MVDSGKLRDPDLGTVPGCNVVKIALCYPEEEQWNGPGYGSRSVRMQLQVLLLIVCLYIWYPLNYPEKHHN